MPNIELRIQPGASNSGDLLLNVQEKTFEYLKSTISPEVRVSAYLDRDWPKVEAMYAELFVDETCASRFKITKLIPGSKKRTDITLPGPMFTGEQLVVIVERKPA